MKKLTKRLATIVATMALVVAPFSLPANAAIGNCEITSSADSVVAGVR